LLEDILITIGLTLLPVSELRGGIPWGVNQGLGIGLVFIICTITNILIFFPYIWLLDMFYDSLLSKWPLFERYLEYTRRRGTRLVTKYGAWGLFFFVAVPLPTTGVYTGTLLAWIFGVDRRQGLIAVIAGVLVAAILVSLITMSIINIPIFIKPSG
jgi:uncharacterized membrane protein